MSTYRRPALSLVFVVALLLMSLTVVAQERTTTYEEGLHFHKSSGYTIAHTELTLHGTKYVDGNQRYTEVTVTCHSGGYIPRTFSGTGILPGDPDELEVSNDLGWGGLNGTIMMLNTHDGQSVPVEVHLSVYPTSRVSFNEWHYRRFMQIYQDPNNRHFFGRAYGTVSVPGYCGAQFGVMPITPANDESAWTFSSRQPFPDE